MTLVARGSRLALRVGNRRLPLRTLADVELGVECGVGGSGGWAVPVLAAVSTAATTPADGILELVTPAGLVTVPARLLHDEHGLCLCSVDGAGSTRQQRRADVRGPVGLDLRAAVLSARGAPAGGTFDGRTLDVSAGGLRLAVTPTPAGDWPAGARIFLELQLPGELLVPAVLGLVEPGTDQVRGAFVDIAAVDRERLVRLVFDEQRRELAARHRARKVPRP